MNKIPIDQLTLETFSAVVRTRFRVYLDGSRHLDLELAETTLLQDPAKASPSGAAAGVEVFSLVFDGPADFLLPQSIYSFEHERIGRFDLFVVPVGQKSGSVQYQAIFNRVRRHGEARPTA